MGTVEDTMKGVIETASRLSNLLNVHHFVHSCCGYCWLTCCYVRAVVLAVSESWTLGMCLGTACPYLKGGKMHVVMLSLRPKNQVNVDLALTTNLSCQPKQMGFLGR